LYPNTCSIVKGKRALFWQVLMMRMDYERSGDVALLEGQARHAGQGEGDQTEP
jgi:hypothetical protein